MMESSMNRRAILFSLLWLCGCGPGGGGHGKAFLGALLIDGSGGPPSSNSVVLTSDGRIQAAGAPSNVPIPADVDRIDGSGKVIVPALIDVCPHAEPSAMLRANDAEQARALVARYAARHERVIYLAPARPEVAEAALEAARTAGIPVLAFITTQDEAKFLVDRGASVLVGMIRDTDDPDPSLLARMRALRITVAPALAQAGSAIDRARRNTEKMFRAGVPIAAASLGGDFTHELELLVEAGLPPLDVLVAATRNGALALHQPDTGSIEPGKRANLLLLSANPGEDIANLRKVVLRLADGEWVR
jgi:imidazolonepropionase-like amidohydrolase